MSNNDNPKKEQTAEPEEIIFFDQAEFLKDLFMEQCEQM